MTNYYLFWLALSLSVLIHELGHAAAMKLLKIPIRLIRWGFGPKLFQVGVFEMRLVPIFGFADAKIRDWSGCEWKGILVGVSGVIAQWIVLVVMKITGFVYVAPTFSVWWFFFCLAALVQFLPFSKTDGKMILSLVMLKRGRKVNGVV